MEAIRQIEVQNDRLVFEFLINWIAVIVSTAKIKKCAGERSKIVDLEKCNGEWLKTIILLEVTGDFEKHL